MRSAPRSGSHRTSGPTSRRRPGRHHGNGAGNVVPPVTPRPHAPPPARRKATPRHRAEATGRVRRAGGHLVRVVGPRSRAARSARPTAERLGATGRYRRTSSGRGRARTVGRSHAPVPTRADLRRPVWTRADLRRCVPTRAPDARRSSRPPFGLELRMCRAVRWSCGSIAVPPGPIPCPTGRRGAGRAATGRQLRHRTPGRRSPRRPRSPETPTRPRPRWNSVARR